MAVVVSADIYGTSSTLGYDSSQGERVVRRHYVEGITGTSQLETAIRAVTGLPTAVSGNPHLTVPAFATTFPLFASPNPVMVRQSVTAKQIGVGKFIVEELYAWNSSSWGNFPTTTLAEYRTGYESVQCYTIGAIQSHGLPGTIAQGASWKDLDDETKQTPGPQPYSFMRPVVRIGVPFANGSGANPMSPGIRGLIGKLNANDVTIAGTLFTAGQLRFDGIEMVARTNSAKPFQGTYMYTASRNFAEHRVYWDTAPGELKWKVAVLFGAKVYETASF
jgi:hypothetical protein